MLLEKFELLNVGSMTETYPEAWSRSQIDSHQFQRLQSLVKAVSQSNPFWKKRFESVQLDPDSIQSLADLNRIPLLTKQELVEDQNLHPPYGTNLTFPPLAYSRLHQTSGTTGKPMRWLDTPESWDWFMQCWSQIYRLIGVTEQDVFAFPFSFGPFIGFWAAFEGAQRRGNLSLAMGGMTSEARLSMILELQATVVCCTPTYALRLTEIAEQLGLPIADSAVRLILVAGEPGGAVAGIRDRIANAWNARVIDHWGMTDMGSLGIEPADRPGKLVLLESECIAEILDPETSRPVESGAVGELVLTNLGRIGQPVIRYRTGDLVRQCLSSTGSTCNYLTLDGGILGRVDDMVTIRGNNVFPSSLDAILREISAIAEYRIHVVTKRSMPHMKVEIEPLPEYAADELALQLSAFVQQRIKERLNFQAEVFAVPVNSLPRFELKGKRFHRE